jgi:hypothetical protein
MRARAVLAAAVASAAFAAGVTVATAGADEDTLGEVRAATARFHSVTQAERAGYTPFADCFDSADGGMGQHYVSDDLLNDNGVVDPAQPEALVYEVRGDQLKLVAVEYIVNQTDVAAAPSLFGHDFHEFGPFYVLHAWVWQDNASGTFADYNPDVTSCP